MCPWERPICVDRAHNASLDGRLLSAWPQHRSNDVGGEHTVNDEGAEYCSSDLSTHGESSASSDGNSTYQSYDYHIWPVVSRFAVLTHKRLLTVIPPQSPVGHHRPREDSSSDYDRGSNK